MKNNDNVEFRFATIDDLPSMVALLNEDILGMQRERMDTESRVRYELAFHAIQKQEGNQILLGVLKDEIIAMLQLTFIPGLAHQGGCRAQIEAVRVKDTVRGEGVGKLLFGKAIEISKQAGCVMVQLTTDRRRDDAIRFYESIGFTPTHWGMKLPI